MVDFAIKASQIESVEYVLLVHFTEVFVAFRPEEPGYPGCEYGERAVVKFGKMQVEGTNVSDHKTKLANKQ